MKTAYIVSSIRTAVGKAPRGSLRNVRPDDLAAIALKGALEQVPNFDWSLVDDVIIGCAFPEGEQGMNLAKVAAMRAGLPTACSGMTVNRCCASGLQAIAMGCDAVASGRADAVVAGGAESMSQIPMGGSRLMPNPTLATDLPEAWMSMGNTGESVARTYNISRTDQDAFALESHRRAIAAQQAGRFADELIPVCTDQRIFKNGETTIRHNSLDHDEGPRANTSLEVLAKLRPAFSRTGSITAGNASQISDGAAATLIVSEKVLKDLKLTPLARLVSYAVAGVPPDLMGIGPVKAVPKALKQAGLNTGDISLIELNEAFAAQAIPVISELHLDPEIVNVNGGAISLGHPLGCTGAKLTATLLHELKRREQQYGLVTMCVGGGMGAAGIFERLT